MRRDSYRELGRLLLLANAEGVQRESEWCESRALVPIAGNETTTDDDVNPPSSPSCVPRYGPGKRENRITEVLVLSKDIYVCRHNLNMKETWESG